MKKFLIGVLTILLTFLFIALGISLNLEALITENIEGIVKEEVTSEIVKEVAKNTNIDEENVKKELTKVMEENDALKNTIEDSLDKIIDILDGKDVENINFSSDLESIINNSEAVLKDYGITITKEEKEELLKMVNSDEFNIEFHSAIQEVQENMPSNAKTAIEIFTFIRSITFKCILIASIVVSVLLIAILKKSYYKWLGNLSEATLISGILFGILMPWFVKVINQELSGSGKYALTTNAINQYGYILIGIGVIALILKVVIAKTVDKKETNE